MDVITKGIVESISSSISCEGWCSYDPDSNCWDDGD